MVGYDQVSEALGCEGALSCELKLVWSVLVHEGRLVCRSNVWVDQLIQLAENKTDDLKGLHMQKLVYFFQFYQLTL